MKKQLSIRFKDIKLTKGNNEKFAKEISKLLNKYANLKALEKDGSDTTVFMQYPKAVITVTFKTVEPGISNITASYKKLKKTLTSSGTIEFSNIESLDQIAITSNTNEAEVVIDIPASPQSMTLTARKPNGIFIIH
ncbi:MAG: hypothetical protein ACK5NK_03850 [Niabella sp.]